MGDQFLWRVKASGVWDTANSWADTTASLSPAPAPPGATDGATIDGPNDQATYLAISGPGSADEFTSTGNVGLTGGAFAFGTLTLGSPGLLNIGAGTAVTAASMSGSTGTVQVSGAGASLSVAGTVTDGGNIIASNGAIVSLAGLSFNAGGFGSIEVDGTSAIEIGPGGGSPPTTGAITVDAGVTIDEPGPLDGDFTGAVVDNGVITAGGTSGFAVIDFSGPVSGSGMLVAVNHGGLAFESSVSANITFSGSDGLVNFEGGSIGTGVISGFAASDSLYFSNMVFDTANYAATGPGLGQVTLAENGTTIGTVTLAGSYDATTTFVPLQDIFGDTVLQLALGPTGAGASGPSAGTGGPDSFAWQPTAGGNWGVAANWLDNGATATVAPGSNDLVTIAGSAIQYQVVRGQGNAQSLSITGDVALGGLFAVGALVDGNESVAGNVALLPGAAVTANSVTVGSLSGTLSVNGASLTVSGGLNEQGSLIVSDHAKVTAASLSIPTIYGVSVDATSILDIGGGGGTAGFLTVEDGAVVNGFGTIAAAVIDNGTIGATQAGGQLTIKGAVTGSGTLLIDASGAAIILDDTVAATDTIMFAGLPGTLQIAGALPAAAIGAFEVGDAIAFKALDFDNVSAATGGGNTTLTLRQDGSAVGTLSLIGSVPADSSIIVTPAPFGGTGELMLLAAGTIGAGVAPPSAGTATSDAYQWNASSGGDWGDVANWTDTSAGSTTVAPGTNDSVVIAGSTSTLQVVSGQGDAASLTISGQLVLGGIFQVGSLNLASFSTVVVTAGATLDAANTTLGTRALDIAGPGAAMHSSGALQFTSFGTVSVDGGGTLTGAGMSTTSETVVNVDSASAIEIGAGGGATAGSIVVDSGVTVDGAFLFSAPLIDNGVISTGTATAQMNASVTGSGTIVIGNGGGLDVSAPIGAGITIEFAGATGTLELSTRAVGVGAGDTITTTGSIGGSPGLANIAAQIVGYSAGDVIEVGGVTVDTADYFVTSPGTGELVIGDNGAPVTTLNLAGDYAGSSFITAPLFGNAEVLMAAPCFAAGTKLLTAEGEVAVEELSIGLLVQAANADLTPIKWIGFREVDCRNHPAPHDVWPVRVRAHAFGDNVPHRDLLLSPDHAVFLDGALIPVRYLLNAATIVQEPVESVTYWHVELARHDVVLAEGLACESYLDTGNRAAMTDGYWLRNGRAAA